VLKLVPPEYRLEFDFGALPSGEGEEAEAVDLSGLTPLGRCPKCGGGVYEQPMSYVCEHGVGGERRCDFRSGRVILQQTIEPEQMKKLLADGRTDILRNFVSNRTRRKFAAFLVWKADEGKVGFEFEPRKGAKAAPAAGEPAAARRATAAKAAKAVAAGKAPAAAEAPSAAKAGRGATAAAPKAAAKKAAAKKAKKTVAKKVAKKPAAARKAAR
jgi:DNA topoisomerase-3